MARAADIFVGARFERLVVIGECIPGSDGKVPVRCDCGTEKEVRYRHLGAGVQSCGCVRAEKIAAVRRSHGLTGSPEYIAWINMKDRCFNPRNNRYSDWGGRGITVCEEWRDDFLAFLAHIGPKPSPKHSIDRLDNDGNYEPGNVRWATQREQVLNSRPKLSETCKNGHPRTPENVLSDPVYGRICRVCQRKRNREHQREVREARRAASGGVEVGLG